MNKIKQVLKMKWVRRLLFLGIGGFLGYLYYTFIGCSTGTCPLTSNPYTTVLYGSGIGLVLSLNGGETVPVARGEAGVSGGDNDKSPESSG